MQDDTKSSPNEHGKSEEVRYTRVTRGDDNFAPSSSSGQQFHTNMTTYLSSLSALAGQSFASTQEAVEAILKLVVDELGLRSSFLTRIDQEECQNEVVMAANLAGGSDIRAGVALELPQTF